MSNNETSIFLVLPEVWQQEAHAIVDRLAVYLSRTNELSDADITEHLVVRDTAQILDALSLITTVFGQSTQNEMLLTTAKMLNRHGGRLSTAHFSRVQGALNTLLGTESQT